MHLFLLLIVVIAVLVALLVRDTYRDHRASQRNLQLRDVADKLGFVLTEEAPPIDQLVQGTRLLQRSSEAHLLLQGQREGCPHRISLFDLNDTTATVLQAEDPAAFPRFVLQPRATFVPVAKILDDADLAARFETIADVGGRSALFGQDFQLDVHEEDLGKLRAKLTGRPREILAARREAQLFIEATGDRLVTYIAGEKIPAAEIAQRLDETIELAQLLSQ